jgi:hypothetical protein
MSLLFFLARALILIRSSREPEPPEGGECPPCRRPKADSSQRMKESKARIVTPRPDIQDGQTAEGGKEEAAGGRFRAKEAAIRSKSPPSVRAFSPDARRPPPGGRRKRSSRPACEHKRRGPAPHLAKPGVQPGAESGSGGLGVPVGFLSNRHDKPGATGTLARGTTTAPPTTHPPTRGATARRRRSGTPGAAKQGA